MLLIDALVLVAQEYSNEQGWIVSCEHGQLMSAPSRRGSYYYAWDASGTRIIGDPRLEVALSALLEREPAGAKDEHWKIEPCMNKWVSNKNILIIAWDKSGNILNASAHHDERAAQAKAEEWTEDEDAHHVVKYYAKFKPGNQPDTTLTPYNWLELNEA